ncbi:MAG: winged helix DNA-binding domain-containing protein [Mycobacteriales bacterium]
MTTGTAVLDWDRVRAWRARRHHLTERAADPARVVSDLCGLHAQLASSAELTLHARVADLAPGWVAGALWTRRALVKTWAMRGTLHLLPTAEYPRWQAALSTLRGYEKPVWLRNFHVTRAELDALLAAVPRALDGRTLPRAELAEEVARLTGLPALAEKLRTSWGAYLKPSATRGDLCFAAAGDNGTGAVFARPDQWLDLPPPAEADPAAADPAAAMAWVARRFLAVNAPATPEDFHRWWARSLSPAAARRLLAGLGDTVEVSVAGTPAWMLAADVAEAAAAEPDETVRLLPAFDQYVVAATRHARRLMPGDFADRVYRPQGWLSPVLLVGGMMAGVWTAEKKGKALKVEVAPFTRLPARLRPEVEAEAERLAAFQNLAVEVRVNSA